MQIADDPQHRLHKGSKRSTKAASGLNPFRGPGRGLLRSLKLGRVPRAVNPRAAGSRTLSWLGFLREPKKSLLGGPGDYTE